MRIRILVTSISLRCVVLGCDEWKKVELVLNWFEKMCSVPLPQKLGNYIINL